MSDQSAQTPETPTINVENEFLIMALEHKLREADSANTKLMALANQQQHEINTLRRVIDQSSRANAPTAPLQKKSKKGGQK